MDTLLDLSWYYQLFIFLCVGITIAVLVTEHRDKRLGYMTIFRVIFIPAMLVYMFTISLPIMPLTYGKNKWGIFAYIPTWLLYALLAVTLSWWLKSVGSHINKLNRLANWFMGYTDNNTVSSELGNKIEDGTASWVACLHCRILAIYDRRGYHCNKKAKRLF